MTINEFFGDWVKVINKRELQKVLHLLEKEYKIHPICPKQKDVFKAFSLCKYNNLKIVMLGYDPYPQKDVATGILFGNKENTNISPSLQVIKDACINLEVPHNCITFDQTLESWAQQGILMINSALTVEMNKTGSHIMLWRDFVASLLHNISEINTGIIYVLFGSQAKTFEPYINKNNYIFKIEHPAYFARTHTEMPSSLFININNVIKGLYNETIKWYKEY